MAPAMVSKGGSGIQSAMTMLLQHGQVSTLYMFWSSSSSLSLSSSYNLTLARVKLLFFKKKKFMKSFLPGAVLQCRFWGNIEQEVMLHQLVDAALAAQC